MGRVLKGALVFGRCISSLARILLGALFLCAFPPLRDTFLPALRTGRFINSLANAERGEESVMIFGQTFRITYVRCSQNWCDVVA